MPESLSKLTDDNAESMLRMTMNALGNIVDLRQASKVVYPVRDIVLLTVVAVCAKMERWVDIPVFGKRNFEALRKYLHIEAIPSHDTIQRVMSSISPDVMKRIYTLWCSCMGLEEETAASLKGFKLLNLDGKTMRGSGGRGRKPVHIVSLWDPHKGVCVGQTAVDAKSNEITAIPRVLEGLELTGHIITSDAMGTQVAIAKQIRDQNGEYLLALKANHSTLYEAVRESAESTEFLQEICDAGGYKRTREKAHGQIEIREYWQTSDIWWLPDRDKWAGLTTIGFERTTLKKDGKVSITWRYFIASLPADIEMFAYAVRRHWSIEAMHNVLDTTLREDDNQTLDRTAAENLNIIRKWIYTILKHLEIEDNKIASMRSKSVHVNQNPEAAMKLLAVASR